MKKRLSLILTVVFAVLSVFQLSSCENNQPKGDNSMDTSYALIEKTKFSPTVYDVSEIKNVEETVFGSFDAWRRVGAKNGGQKDYPTANSVINSPFHTLTVNGVSVPVYTARCGEGAHSFAWIDITSEGDFALDLTLSLSVKASKCVVLPRSKNVFPSFKKNTAKCVLTEEGSYTFTFAEKVYASHTDPKFAPLTIMVSRKDDFSAPEGYKTVEINPGYHENEELKFTEENTAYYIKAGFHDISSISLPSNSVLFIEQGAYIKATDRMNSDGSHNSDSAISILSSKNARVISRGLLDCGMLLGGGGKYKHVVTIAQTEDTLVKGLTIINSNTWTICLYSANKPVIERNLLLSYRTYSDGIMMSECTYGVGRYNFVRTGDDAIEFKGTGWWNGENNVGHDCVYEYNDIWTDKGAGYCLTWESSRPMYNMTFRNNSIGFAQPVWVVRNTAIDCLLGTDINTSWSNILFENIEIYHVISPNAINVHVEGTGAKLENVTFRNITVESAREGVYAFRMHYSARGGCISNIALENVTFCGQTLSEDDINDEILFCNEANEFYDELTVE